MAKRAEGCRFLHIAPQKNTAGVITFGEPIALEGLESISTTNGYAEATAYSDNQMDTNKRKPSFIDLALVVRELSTKNEALIHGQKYVNGKKITSANDTAPMFAVLWQQTNSDGTYTNRVCYNVTLTRDGNENTTVGESVTYDTVALTGKAIPLASGEIDLVLESDDEAVLPDDLANFFTSVVMPTESSSFKSAESLEAQIKEYKQEIEALKKEKKEKKVKEVKEVNKKDK